MICSNIEISSVDDENDQLISLLPVVLFKIYCSMLLTSLGENKKGENKKEYKS